MICLYCIVNFTLNSRWPSLQKQSFVPGWTHRFRAGNTDAVILSCNCPWNALVPHWLQPWLLPFLSYHGQIQKRDTCKLICTKFICFCQGPPLLGDHEEHRQHQDNERTCVRPRAGLEAQLQRGHQDCWPHQDAGLPRWSFQAKWIWGWFDL